MPNYSRRHGGPWDRGSADSYYRRKFDPHYYTGNTYSSTRVTIEPDTSEWEAYAAGWSENEESGNFKDY